MMTRYQALNVLLKLSVQLFKEANTDSQKKALVDLIVFLGRRMGELERSF